MKKTVGIITLTGNNNYGNRLQNYATEFILKKYGFIPITIKNAYGLNNKTNYIKYIYKYSRYFLSIVKNDLIKSNKKRLKCFKEFDKNINVTKKLYTINSIKRLKCDYYIVGSDQVWKPTYGRLSDLDLLTFVEPRKRISYSSSFGIEKLPLKYEEKAKKEFLKFKSISVREDAGKKIVENLTNRKDVSVLIDPTMMLNSSEWDKVSKKPKQIDIMNGKKYILNYFLGDVSEKTKNIIKEFAKENDCYIINLLDKNDPFYETGPSEFLYLEKNAFLVCTDSFHSSVFSIMYDTPFVVFDREDKKDNMNSRITTLLSKFSLEDRKYHGKLNDETLKHDYSIAYKILNEERNKSEEFLKNALEIE